MPASGFLVVPSTPAMPKVVALPVKVSAKRMKYGG
jgi:hypothetical protein